MHAPDFTPREEGLHRASEALEVRFDRAVGQVAHPTGHPVKRGLFGCGRSKEDPLNATVDDDSDAGQRLVHEALRG